MKELHKMRRLIIMVLFLVVGIGVASSQEPQETKEPSLKPKDGFVPDAATTVKIAEAVVVRQIVVHHIKRMDFFLLDGGSSVGDCMLIRRSAKMLAEIVDCAWPGLKKSGSQKNSS